MAYKRREKYADEMPLQKKLLEKAIKEHYRGLRVCPHCGKLPKLVVTQRRSRLVHGYYFECPRKPSIRTYENMAITPAIKCWNFIAKQMAKEESTNDK